MAAGRDLLRSAELSLKYLHDVLACSSTNRLLSSLNPASRLNQKLLMTACQTPSNGGWP
jgi:hypothetical protein